MYILYTCVWVCVCIETYTQEYYYPGNRYYLLFPDNETTNYVWWESLISGKLYLFLSFWVVHSSFLICSWLLSIKSYDNFNQWAVKEDFWDIFLFLLEIPNPVKREIYYFFPPVLGHDIKVVTSLCIHMWMCSISTIRLWMKSAGLCFDGGVLNVTDQM